MKGHVGAFLFGLSVAAAGAFIYDKYRRGEISVDQISDDIQDISGAVRDKVSDLAAVAATTIVDINQASAEDFERIGLHDSEMVQRLIEGRPYRNKIDLISRMILPQDIYEVIKNQIDIAHPDEAVKVA